MRKRRKGQHAEIKIKHFSLLFTQIALSARLDGRPFAFALSTFRKSADWPLTALWYCGTDWFPPGQGVPGPVRDARGLRLWPLWRCISFESHKIARRRHYASLTVGFGFVSRLKFIRNIIERVVFNKKSEISNGIGFRPINISFLGRKYQLQKKNK